ncbi:MAG: S41 family peptidase [Fimbriiglobus sp.]
MLRFYTLGLVLIATTLPLAAAEPIRFARTPDISPDGQTVAFTYAGDVWVAPSTGGVARPVTLHEAHDYFPVFSPNGTDIAFSSNRHGSYDVFVVSVMGGKPRRLTFDSGHETVTGWTPDGSGVIFSTTRSTEYPFQPECWIVSAQSGGETRLPLADAKEAYLSPLGGKMAFVSGPGNWYRRGYRGTSTDEIYISDGPTKPATRFSNFSGNDGSPMWAADGKAIYYVTEEGSKPGCANIVRRGIKDAGLKVITKHATDSVRRARISKNGEKIVYECGLDLWVLDTASGETKKLLIEAPADEKQNSVRNVTFTRDATSLAIAPDDSAVVLTIHGELFLTKLPMGGKCIRLTDHPALDGSVHWSPDGKKLVFLSDRTGVDDLHVLESDDPDQAELTKATKFKTRAITKTQADESAAMFSPRGDKIAFLRDGQLFTINPDGTGEKCVLETPNVVDYDWSPDGKKLVFARVDGSFASELYITTVDKPAPVNITRYATFHNEVSWSQTGGKLAFLSGRRGGVTPHVMSLQFPTSEKNAGLAALAISPSEVDFPGVHLRVSRPANLPADSVLIAPNGSGIVFRSQSNGFEDLWFASSDGNMVNRITTGNTAPRAFAWAKKSAGLLMYLTREGELRGVRVAIPGLPPPASTEPQRIGFTAKMQIDDSQEFAQMLSQARRLIGNQFYDKTHHGIDWWKTSEKYTKAVDEVRRKEDLYALIYLMLGELNSSHVGISGRLPTAEELTGDLGFSYAESQPRAGVRIARITPFGPLDRPGTFNWTNAVITSIDGTELTATSNLSQLLNGKIGETVVLQVQSAPTVGDAGEKLPGKTRRFEVVPVSREKSAQLKYDAWVQDNAKAVEKASEGKLGYLHIPSMDEDGVEAFMRSLYSENLEKEGLVIDIRNNGGGYTHDQILGYLTGPPHSVYRTRMGTQGNVFRQYDRKFTKPSVLLINNRSYSDAEILASAYREMKLGKIVGQATGGQVIGTTTVRLVDGSSFQVPRTGIFRTSGENMEKVGVKPDVVRELAPGELRNRDPQLDAALEALRQELKTRAEAKAPGRDAINRVDDQAKD